MLIYIKKREMGIQEGFRKAEDVGASLCGCMSHGPKWEEGRETL